MRSSLLVACGVAVLVTLSGCKSRSSSGTAMRLAPVQVWSDQVLDAARHVDRDGTTNLQISTTTVVYLKLARPVVSPKVTVQGARERSA